MKVRLWVKLSISFMAVILIFGIILTAITRLTLEAQFTRYIQDSDVRLSQQIAGVLTEEISLTYGEKQVSEQQFFSLLDEDPGEEQPLVSPPMRHMRDQSSSGLPMFTSMMHRGSMFPQSIAVTDTDGNIRKMYGPAADKGPVRTDSGTPVVSRDAVVGYVFAGTMLDAGLDAYHRDMLSSLDRSILTAALIAFAASLAVSILLFAHIISPVSALRKAADSIGMGRYGARVDVNRRDELGDLSKSFNSMAQSLERSETWKRRVINDSAHELRTPVTLLASEIEMLLEGLYIPDKEQLIHMQREVHQLSRLIDELQNLSTVESGTLTLSVSSVSLCSLLEQVISSFSQVAAKKQVSIVRRQALAAGCIPMDEDTLITCDSRRIEQVFTNVLSNAIRHADEGGTVDVTCAFDSRGEPVISVEDSGSGIPADTRELIFERFYRIDKHRGRESGGAGLGLAISLEIVKLHKGTMRAVEPAVLGGGRIEILFPRSVVKPS